MLSKHGKLQNKFYSAVIKNDAKRLTSIFRKHQIDMDAPLRDATPLIYAATHGYNGIARKLLQNGANPDALTTSGTSALRWACYHKNKKLVILLLRYRADPNAKNRLTGETALHVAASIGNVKIVRLLLNAGAKTRLVQKQGKTALDYAKDMDNNPALIALLKDVEQLEKYRKSHFRKYCKSKRNPLK